VLPLHHHLPPQPLIHQHTPRPLQPNLPPRKAPNPPSPSLLPNLQLPQNPPALAPDLTLKDPIAYINKIYCDLVFPIKAQGDLDAMAIQCLYLTKFLTLICQVDETAVLLPYKSFFALNKEVLYAPDKLGQSYTAVSKYFQGFFSHKIMDKMYVSVLVAYNSSQEDFYKSLWPNLETSESRKM